MVHSASWSLYKNMMTLYLDTLDGNNDILTGLLVVEGDSSVLLVLTNYCIYTAWSLHSKKDIEIRKHLEKNIENKKDGNSRRGS